MKSIKRIMSITLILLLATTSLSMAAPKVVYYQLNGETIEADYEMALDNEHLNNDNRMLGAIQKGLQQADANFEKTWIKDSDGIIINWSEGLKEGYKAALENPKYHEEEAPEATKKVGEDGVVVDKEEVEEGLVVESVSDINSINVDFGTPVEELDLILIVEVTLNNEETDVANIEWNTENYNPELEGEQVLQGTLVIPEGKEWTIPEEFQTVTVKVIVGEEIVDTKVAIEKVETTVGNDNTVIVTFEEDAELAEKDLVDTTIVLTEGETSLIATYEAKSYKNGKAKFKLEKEDKLIDAVKYTVSSKNFKVEYELLSKTVKAYPASFEKITKDVVAADQATIYLSAKDQYGKEFDLSKDTTTTVKATLNGMPINARYTTGVITIERKLNKDDELVITLTHSDKVSVKPITYTVIEGQDLRVEKIKLELNPKDKKNIAFGDELTIKLIAEDQYESPIKSDDKLIKDKINWFMNDEPIKNGTQLIKSDNIAFNEDMYKEQGSFTIKAFYTENTKKNAEITITVGAADLNGIKLENTKDNTSANISLINNEEAKVAQVTSTTPGAILEPKDIQYFITSQPKDSNATITFAYDGKDDTKSIYATMKVDKAGDYKFKVYTLDKLDEEGKEVSDSKGVVSGEITVKSYAKLDIDSFKLEEFKENELTVGDKVDKVVTFKNEYGEEIIPTVEKLSIVESDKEGIVAISKIKTIDKAQKFVIEFEAKKAGDYVVTLVSGALSPQQIPVKVVAKAELTKINVDDKVRVINNDDTEVYLPISFEDQYGNTMELKYEHALSVTSIEKYTVKFYDKDKVEVTEQNDQAIEFIGFKTKLDEIPSETTNIAISKGEAKATVNVTVLEDRVPETITYKKEIPTKMVLNNEFKVEKDDFKAIDQYNKEFSLEAYNLEVKGEDASQVLEINNNNNIKANKPGTEKVTIKISKDEDVVYNKEITITVGTADDIQTLVINPVGKLNKNANKDKVKEEYNIATLTFTAKDIDGNIISMPVEDLTWISSDKDVATVNNKGEVTALAAGTVTITAIATNGVSATVEVIVVDEEIKATTIEFLENLKTEINFEDTINILKNIKVYDQNNVEMVIKDKDIVVTSTNEQVAKIEGIDVKGVGEGTATIRVLVGENFKTIKVTVKYTEDQKSVLKAADLFHNATYSGNALTITFSEAPDAGVEFATQLGDEVGGSQEATDKSVILNVPENKTGAINIIIKKGDAQTVVNSVYTIVEK